MGTVPNTNRCVVMMRVAVRVSASILIALAVSIAIVDRINAQEQWHSLRVASVEITEVSQTTSEVRYEAAVRVLNSGTADFDAIQRVDYQIDDGPSELAYVITKISAGQGVRFTFQFDLTPGRHELRIIIGGSVYETHVDVSAADLTIEIASDRVIQGGIVELDLEIVNRGNRAASDIRVIGAWIDVTTGAVGEAVAIPGLDSLEPGSIGETRASFNINPGTIKFRLMVTSTSVEADLADNLIEVVYDVEFVELIINFKSADSIRWVSEKSALMQVTVEVSNIGVDVADDFTVGFDCVYEDCTASQFAGAIAPGETIETVFQVWMPIGKVTGNLYAGANDDGFRWGHLNVVPISLTVPDSPPLEWTLARVTDVQELQYWSDGSANVIFETSLQNNGSDLVSGELPISVQCIRYEIVIDDCGGEYSVQIDPTSSSNLRRHTIKVPQGQTSLYFAQADSEPIVVAVVVPQRILGVERDVWDCFSDTSNVGKDVPDDFGVGCAGWRNDYIVKWPNGQPINVWMEGDEAYKAIFSRLLKDLEPVLNLQFEIVSSPRETDISAFLGLPRIGTDLERLGCNHAAGCATFNVQSDGTIADAHLAVWPPTTSLDQIGIDHMVYSIALHELLHVLTGMLHRHHDETSVMSYLALDYTTLSQIDMQLFDIALHPLVEPGMRFDEIREQIVFNDELVDPLHLEELTVRDVLRRSHAKLMDAGSARYVLTGGWPSCDYRFDQSEYTIGNFNPRGPKWTRFTNDQIDFYMTRSPTLQQGLQFWVQIFEQWVQASNNVIQNRTSFRDSFSNPLGLLSSINIYADDANIEVISDPTGRITLRASYQGADVVVDWSRKTIVDVEMEIDTEDFTVERYKIDWTFDPVDENFCSEYNVEAQLVEYGLEFLLPEQIRVRIPSAD